MDYGCIGEKLTHSFSKEIHNLLFDYDYKIQEIPKGELHNFMTRKDFKAINVTIPYKQDVIPYLDWISDTAMQIGAVNTIINRDGKLYGYNTDFSGMTALIKRQGIEIKDKTVLVLGSGGTSKTAVAVAKSLDAKAVIRVSRTAKEDCITYEDMYERFCDAEVIINTTPCGMYPNIIGEPIDIDRFTNLEAVVDAIYNPLRSNLVVKAEQKGINAIGGLYMLVAQAAQAAELFVDENVPIEKIDKVYHEIVKQKQNIVLVGMPSSGKTTVGKRLAAELNMQFVDTDKEIEKTSGKTITEIFTELGESAFRDIELSVIADASARQNAIIATGGGAVLREQNITLLKGNGKIYFIDRPLELLITTDDRPLSSNRDDLIKRYNERYEIYCNTCDKRFVNDNELNYIVNDIKEDFLNENTGNKWTES
ncbi:MAG: shikimate dehydrogenase [Clostridia bacterium]|nr:shikimate dehydrogenase [Clostridia bacterium]